MSENDERYMRRCMELAEKAAEAGDVPVGAVVTDNGTGEIISEGYNCRESMLSPLAHAELIAIKGASEKLGGWHLEGCTLYVTLEPCAMCAGAVVNSRISRVVWGASDLRFGACGSKLDLFAAGLNHTPETEGGVLKEECTAQLKGFFKQLRERGKRYKQTEDSQK